MPTAPLVVELVPSGHAMHPTTVCPRDTPKVPGSQGEHVDALAAPMALENVPTGHVSHATARARSEKVPGLHSAHVAVPAEDAYVPGTHSVQASELSAPKVGFSYPAPQSMQKVMFSSGWYLPAAHRTHSDAPFAGCARPGGHAKGFAEPSGQKLPAVQLFAFVIQSVWVMYLLETPAGHNLH